MTQPVNSRALWDAVDAITKPSTRRVMREPDADYLAELADAVFGVCDVKAYRAATISHGLIPSLWEQAEQALTVGREQMDGGRSPGSSRSPADLDLMETMLTIRESMAWQLPGRGITPRSLSVQDQMRQLAAHVVTHEPQHIDWWAYRFGQWARLLGTYLRAIDQGPRPIRLRNAACPLCKTRQVTIDTDQGEIVAGPLLIDFENGWIRAATCTACTAVWWRGSDLGDLAALLDPRPESETLTA